VLVRGVVDRLAETFDIAVTEGDAERETVSFKLPRALVE
jgi:4-hydroxy-3-methylbut-2-enyl diphosphate reductase